MNAMGLKMMKFDNEEDVVGLPYSEWVADEDVPRVGEFFELARAGLPSHFEFRGSEPEMGMYKSCFIPIKNGASVVERILGMTEDVTEQKLAAEKILRMATHDSLTGLPNRTLLSDRLEQAIRTSKRTGDSCALLFIDLDKFKPVNDRYGHNVGDILLQKVAERLESITREMDTIARF